VAVDTAGVLRPESVWNDVTVGSSATTARTNLTVVSDSSLTLSSILFILLRIKDQSYFSAPNKQEQQGEKVEVGRVSGDYPVPAGYSFKVWPDPGNLSRTHDFWDSQLYLTQ